MDPFALRGDFGYSRYGYRGGIGTDGVLLVILIIHLLLGRGRFEA